MYIYTHKVGTLNLLKQTLIVIKGQIGSDTIIRDDFYSPLLSLDMSLQKKKKTQLKNVKVKLYHRSNGLSRLIHKCPIQQKQNTLFPQEPMCSSLKSDSILDHKSSRTYYRRIEIIFSLPYQITEE